ncbi:MAG: isochorismatase family protein [Myxococcales bacterium]|nr:isochorismatase family protein [Myxococcales bacterium]
MELEGLLPRGTTALVVVDIQEKLFPHVQQGEKILANSLKVIEFCKRLEIPILVTEQYPKGLGASLPVVKEALGDEYRPIPKTAFSCFGEPEFVTALEELDVETLVLIGIETHVCVLQTALVGMAGDYDIMVLADCVSSRDTLNHELGLRRLGDEGALIGSSEMFFYEMLVAAKTDDHKAVFDLLK